ncbi:MAG: hypothetical protein SWQ30_21840 [Thermodesulfobacteriota bacterium]|nr:hypothetical protein [Thermodesulfobacteriota bacterium]
MNQIKPKIESTVHSPDYREWAPSSFETFLVELAHIINSCEGNDPAPLFRGQTNYEWFVDSTFVRYCIQHIFDIEDYHALKKEIRQSTSFHRTITSLILLKFGTVWKPSRESLEREKKDDIDPWFELLKNLQQSPEKDYFINGTFLLDWSRSKDIALYFATFQGKGKDRKVSSGHGALWVCDAGATGKSLQTKKVGEMLKLMSKEAFSNGNRTLPLLFHPPKQTFQGRAKNQVPVYIAQMDYRYDVADIWAGYENQNRKQVFVKLILNEELKETAAKYVESQGVTENIVYPE